MGWQALRQLLEASAADSGYVLVEGWQALRQLLEASFSSTAFPVPP
jgi:hypothetical protein